MKKTSFLKKLTAMAATLAMTCVMAVGAFAAEPAVDYKLDSASISVGETWTMSVPVRLEPEQRVHCLRPQHGRQGGRAQAGRLRDSEWR